MQKVLNAMYSEVVKQSLFLIALTPETSAIPARFIAEVIVLRTCGSTYWLPWLSATLSSKRRRAVLWPQPLIRGICSSLIPLARANFSAYSRDARNTHTAPSVTCEQSAIRIRPPTAGLSSVRHSACSLFMYQVRVWAFGFFLAFA